jgi:hypothetical protein
MEVYEGFIKSEKKLKKWLTPISIRLLRKLAIIFFYRKSNSTEKAEFIIVNSHFEEEFNATRRKIISYRRCLFKQPFQFLYQISRTNYHVKKDTAIAHYKKSFLGCRQIQSLDCDISFNEDE